MVISEGNPHHIMQPHLQSLLNRSKSIALLIQVGSRCGSGRGSVTLSFVCTIGFEFHFGCSEDCTGVEQCVQEETTGES